MLPSSGDTRPASIVLPMITLATAHAAAIARFARSAMLEILNEPYMRTARAKGLSAMARNLRHALPNALVPIVTIMGLKFGHLVAGAIVIETVFAWPGIGRLLVQSVDARDLAVVQALVLMMAASMSGIMLALHMGLTRDWVHEWPRQFIIAWPIAFVLTQVVGRLAFAIVGRLRPVG